MFLVACGFKSCLITSWFLRWLVTLWYSPELKWFNPHDCLNLQVWCSTLPPFNPPLIFWVQIPQVFPSAIARGPRSLPGSDATGARDATLTAAWAGDDAVAALEGLGQLRLVRHHPRHRRHRHRHRRGGDDDDDELENYIHGFGECDHWHWMKLTHMLRMTMRTMTTTMTMTSASSLLMFSFRISTWSPSVCSWAMLGMSNKSYTE